MTAPLTSHQPWEPTIGEELVFQRWRLALERARSREARLYDGKLLRLERYGLDNGKLRLDLRPTSFRFFAATNLSDTSLPPEDRADPLGVSAIVVTADDHIVLGRRSQRVFGSPGSVHCIAGHVDLTHLSSVHRGRVDVFSAILDEVREELGVTSDVMTGTQCIGLVREPLTRQPELIFVVGIAIPRREVAISNEEHDRLVFIENRKQEIESYLQREGEALIQITSTTLGLYCAMM